MPGQLSEPTVVGRDARPYLGVRAVVTMATIDEVIATLVGEVLDRVGSAPETGVPFVRYDVIDMQRELVIEVGVPVADAALGDARLTGGVLPEGRYLRATHVGPYDNLEHATGQFLGWASEHGHVFDVRPGDDGEVWGCRLEHYPTDPAQEPDPQRWETVLEFRLRD
jgi:effector-binding domain-containing protein